MQLGGYNGLLPSCSCSCGVIPRCKVFQPQSIWPMIRSLWNVEGWGSGIYILYIRIYIIFQILGMNSHLCGTWFLGTRWSLAFSVNAYWMWSSLVCYWLGSEFYILWRNDSITLHRDYKYKFPNFQNDDYIGNSGNICFSLLQSGTFFSLFFSIQSGPTEKPMNLGWSN